MWTITHPTGGTATFAALGLAEPQIIFKAMGISTATVKAVRNFDNADAWWTDDSLVTIYRDEAPYFKGRVQEHPDRAGSKSGFRTLSLADAWQDLDATTYRELWGIGSGSYLYPRCVLGMNSAGAFITTGAQIREVITYAISQGVDIQLGTVAEGYQLWPSEVRNISCEAVIVGELRFNPDVLAWIDHSTSPPTFNALSKSAMESVTVDVADLIVESFQSAPVTRTVPKGVSIIYESAETIDGEVYRRGYLDEAGDTSGRRVIRAMIDLEGLGMAIQKARIQTRTMPTEDDTATMTAYFKLKYPELKDMPDGAFSWSDVSIDLIAPETLPNPINTKAGPIHVDTADDLPRELINGSIEDWMRVKVGTVLITYSLKIIGSPSDAQKLILANFEGKGRTLSVTATNATTKIYKGISSFTAGEGRPTGLAAAVFAAATVQQYEGNVVMVDVEVPAARWQGKKLTLVNGTTTIMAEAVIHAASVDVETGTVTVDFGPMPYLSAGDLLELQRTLHGRKPTWHSAQERTSNKLGSQDTGSAHGDKVDGFHAPKTISPPGGGSSGPPLPFVLECHTGAGDAEKYSIGAGAITDGTNGGAIDLSGIIETDLPATAGWVVISAAVDDHLVLSGWASTVEADAPDEVVMTDGAQTKLNLLVGQITVDTETDIASAFQALYTSVIIVNGFINGTLVKVFAAAPTQRDEI